MTVDSFAPTLTRRRPTFSFGRWLERGSVFSWLMVGPPIAFLAALVGYPFFYGIWLSLQDRPVAKEGTFVFLDNYIAARHHPAFCQVAVVCCRFCPLASLKRCDSSMRTQRKTAITRRGLRLPT